MFNNTMKKKLFLFSNIKQVFGVLSIFLLYTNTFAQKAYVFTTSSSNISGNYAVIDLPELNGKNSVLFSAQIVPESAAANRHAIGVWYTGSRWSVFNQDKAAMPANVSFLLTFSDNCFLQKANTENVRNNEMLLDHPAINGNSNSKFTITQNWNPDGIGGIYNQSEIGKRFDTSMGKWVLINQSGATIPIGAAFTIMEEVSVSPTPITGSVNSNTSVSTSPIISASASTANATSNQSDPAIYNFIFNGSNSLYQSLGVRRSPIGASRDIGDGFKEQDMRLVNYVAKNNIFNPQTDVLYAGSLIQTKPYFERSTLSPINEPVRAGTITIEGVNGAGNGSLSRALPELSLAAYKDAVRDIIRGVNVANSSGELEFSFKSCRTIEHGMVEVGLNFRHSSFRADGGLHNTNDYEKSVVVGIVKQKYYTVNYTPPSDLRNMFHPSVTLAMLQQEGLVANDNKPSYISSVDYGRIFIMVVESEASADSLKAFLEANYRGATVQAGGRFDFQRFKNQYNLSIKIYTVGSNNNAEEIDIIDPSAFKNFLKRGGTATVQNLGSPIAFAVRNFSGNEIPTILTADYSDIIGKAQVITYRYNVSPGNCGHCVKNGVVDRAEDGRQLMLSKGDILSFSATGAATHGPWLWSAAKSPDGQPGEQTDPADKLPCVPNSCECNRFALVANIPNAQTGKAYTCIGSSKSNLVVSSTMPTPLGFTFNDFKTDDGEGGFVVTVSHISYEQLTKEKIGKSINN